MILFLLVILKLVYCSTIILFGDSLTQLGFDENGWATKLQKSEAGIQFINEGRGGYTTELSLPLLQPLLNKYSKGPENTLALTVIFLGTNDAFLPSSGLNKTVPVPRYIANLKQMIGMVLAKSRLVLITPPPIDEIRDQTRTLANVKLYRDACLRVASEYNIPVLDTWTLIMKPNGIYSQLIADEVYYDGVHFTTKGNDIIYSGISKQIRQVLMEENQKSSSHASSTRLIATATVESSNTKSTITSQNLTPNNNTSKSNSELMVQNSCFIK
ncbi:isoamyl acetate-hydrolyzing esterase [Globomyces sp. JEL0801]|nr:isoamyl acetate-hydrolyzing esterase [Globomyces sp. JEL0801]